MKKKRILYGALSLGLVMVLSSCTLLDSLRTSSTTSTTTSATTTSSTTTLNTTTNTSTTTLSTTTEVATTTSKSTSNTTSSSTTTNTTTSSNTTTSNTTTSTETTSNTTTVATTTEDVITTTDTTPQVNYEMQTLGVTRTYSASMNTPSTLTTYFIDESLVPYVSMEDFLYILSDKLSYNSISKTYDSTTNTYTYERTNSDGDTYTITISPSNNEITLNNCPFYIDALANSNTYSLTSKRVKTTKEYVISPETVTINLSDYNMQMYQIDNKALLPVSIINSIIASPLYYNVYFTGSGYVCDSSTASNQEKSMLFGNISLEDDEELREYSYNTLAFIYDNLFGLKTYRGYESVYEMLEPYKEDLLKTDGSDIEALTSFLYTFIDDGHTGISSYKFGNTSEVDSTSLGERRTKLNKAYQTLENYYKASKFARTSSPYRASGNTAVIEIDSFSLDSSDSSNDTYSTLKSILNSINGQYKNIALNLGLNGGGSIASMVETLGLLTDNDIVMYTYNELTGALIKYTYQVDVDLDGDFTDDDSYASTYDFYILASGYTYSAANEFTNLCIENNIAKTLGKHTGGGACVVLPTSLPDGTSFQTSGPVCLCNYDEENNTYEIVDDGVDVDYDYEYSNFYSVTTLNAYINNL